MAPSAVTPEQQARVPSSEAATRPDFAKRKTGPQIDCLLTASGWLIQDYKALNLSAGRGIAIREVPLKTGPCDYLLLFDRKPVGVIEAKKAGMTLATGTENQTQGSVCRFAERQSWRDALRSSGSAADIKPLECLLFPNADQPDCGPPRQHFRPRKCERWDRSEIRDTRSRTYFEQMKGRGTRVLTPPSRTYWTAMRLASSAASQSERWPASEPDLQSVSGADARSKTHFVIVDAVGVCDGVRQHGDGVVKQSGTARRHRLRARRARRPFGRRGSQSDKTDSRPLERQRTVPFPQLLLGVALGKRDEDTLTTLADPRPPARDTDANADNGASRIERRQLAFLNSRLNLRAYRIPL